MSPTKVSTKTPGKSPTKKMAKFKKPIALGGEEKEGTKKNSGLASPTSITMQQTFLIKNADESFDAYHQQMRKRKLGQANAELSGSPGPAGSYNAQGAWK